MLEKLRARAFIARWYQYYQLPDDRSFLNELPLYFCGINRSSDVTYVSLVISTWFVDCNNHNQVAGAEFEERQLSVLFIIKHLSFVMNYARFRLKSIIGKIPRQNTRATQSLEGDITRAI